MKTVIVVNEMDAQGNATDITVYGDVVPVGMFRGREKLVNVTIAPAEAGPITQAYNAAMAENAKLRSRCNELEIEKTNLRNQLFARIDMKNGLEAENAELRSQCAKLEAKNDELCFRYEKLAEECVSLKRRNDKDQLWLRDLYKAMGDMLSRENSNM